MPQYTDEQVSIFEHVQTTDLSLIVRARAGSGKTFSLIKCLELLRGSTVLMAFNKSIATELSQRTSSLPFETRLNLEIGTVHALGLKAYTKGLGTRPRVQGGKINFIIKDLLAANSTKQKLFKPVTYTLSQLVGAAKSNGFGITHSPEPFPSIDDDSDWQDILEHHNWDIELEEAKVPAEAVIEFAQLVLRTSNTQDTLIDFDDMIYLPLLRNYRLPTYANVLIDEAQDISATRREMAFRMLNPDGRIIAVGDDRQAIYGFTGADAESLDNIQRRSGAPTLPLTICWRCDEAIIAEAQKKVPDIRARPGAGPGEVFQIEYLTLVAGLNGGLSPETKAEIEPLLPRDGDAILCRLNRPNVTMCLQLLRSGRRARIEGRDLGKKLLSHAKAATNQYLFLGLPELIVEVETWAEATVRMLASKERQTAADLLEDEVGCLVILMERAIELYGSSATFEDLEHICEQLFADDIPPSGTITLSSVHKSKGREWGRVFILGRFDYMPFWRAHEGWEMDQEHNLIYVATTRAERHLIHVNGVQEALAKKD